MKYDVNDLEKRISSRRKRFLVCVFALLAFIIAAFVIIKLGLNDTLSFWLIVCEFLALAALGVIIYMFSPIILFSNEIRGENIKEVEYIGVRDTNWEKNSQYSMRKGSEVRVKQTGTNAKKRTDGVIRSSVYLKLEGGDVKVITDLYKSSTDIYEEGDVLVKYSGAKYPIIENRSVSRQPCPLCGDVNDESSGSCKGCGLGILKEK